MVGKARKLLLAAFVALFAVCAVLFAVCTAYAGTKPSFEMSADGDKIEEIGQSYSAEDSYVYTARVRFTEGQAAGIAFGITDKGAFVLNIDREANRTKLMYFVKGADRALSATELYSDYYIGNANCTVEELARVQGKVADKSEFYLKVAVTGGDAPAVKCYVDDILRFEYDGTISLQDVVLNGESTVTYEGGALGANVFHATASFDEVYFGSSDFTRYTELYRNQYHYSPFSGWNNDPNGLVFDGEYYHLYYQHQPFQKLWGDMYWGHARSKDLVTWENLPLALLPTDGNYMWSGSAIIDKGNVSRLFDPIKGSPDYDNGAKNIIIYYTVDGGPNQDQWMAYSLDGGMSFIKHKRIIGGADVDNGITFRDPKVFEVQDGVWGILIGGGQFRFYTSTNLTDWKFAGDMPIYAECPDIYKLPAGNGDKWVINVGGIGYVVGDLSYNEGEITFTDQFGVELTADATQPEDVHIFDLDNANGSYATQTFYIDDTRSKYNGEIVGLSWFAGQPGYQAPMDEHVWLSGGQAVGPDTGAEANNRSIWNGGFTFPVRYSLTQAAGTVGGEPRKVWVLRQTPIAALDGIAAEAPLYSEVGLQVSSADENPLADVSGNTLRITARVETQAQRFGFRVFIGDGEYTEIGYDRSLGYYLDRTHTSSGNTVIANYSAVYSSGTAFAPANGVYDFVILLDRGSLEMFCEDYTQVFYANTFAGYYSDGLEFFIEGEESALLDLTVEEIGSTFRGEAAAEDTKLTLSAEEAVLDTVITTETEIAAYVSGGGSVEWQAENEGIVSLTPTENGVKLAALSSGQTTLTALLKDGQGTVLDSKSVTVEVLAGGAASEGVSFSVGGIRAGEWHAVSEGIRGTMSGDGFLLSDETAADFTFEATANVSAAGAAALVFRADAEMEFYYVANYDRAKGIVKVWSPEQEFINVQVGPFDTVTLRIRAEGNTFTYFCNGQEVGSFTDENAPESGYLGLNVFNGTAVFSSVQSYKLHGGAYTYDGTDVTFYLSSDAYVNEVLNFTLGNAEVDRSFYTVSGNELTVSSAYLRTLPAGQYTLLAVTDGGTDEFALTVTSVPLTVGSVTLTEKTDVHVNIGAAQVTGVEINGVPAAPSQYGTANGVLTIGADALSGGVNSVTLVLADGSRVSFTVTAPADPAPEEPAAQAGWGDILFYIVGCAEAALIIVLLGFVIAKRHKAKKVK